MRLQESTCLHPISILASCTDCHDGNGAWRGDIIDMGKRTGKRKERGVARVKSAAKAITRTTRARCFDLFTALTNPDAEGRRNRLKQ